MHAQPIEDEHWIAWAAGLFEGEGCIHVIESDGCMYARLSLTTTDRDVLDRFQSVIVAGTVKANPPPKQVQWKQSYRWYLSRTAEIERVLHRFMPYLGKRRSSKAQEALEVCSHVTPRSETHCHRGHEYTEANTMVEPNTGYRRCRICRRNKGRVAARRRLGIPPENYRIHDEQEARDA
jgi:hypothetical protein